MGSAQPAAVFFSFSVDYEASEGAEADGGGGVGDVTRYQTGGNEMSCFYTRLFVLSAMLLPVLAGCESYERPMGDTIAAIADARQGQDCHLYVGGIGGVPDLTGAQAMRAGGITKLRSAEYSVTGFAGLGHECVNAHGE